MIRSRNYHKNLIKNDKSEVSLSAGPYSANLKLINSITQSYMQSLRPNLKKKDESSNNYNNL